MHRDVCSSHEALGDLALKCCFLQPGLALKGVVLAEEEGRKLGDLLEVADIPGESYKSSSRPVHADPPSFDRLRHARPRPLH